MRDAVDTQAKHTQHAAARATAVQLLGSWAEASVLNCGKLAAMQVGPALTQVAAASSSQPNSQHLQHHLCRYGPAMLAHRSAMIASVWLLRMPQAIGLAVKSAALGCSKLSACAAVDVQHSFESPEQL